MIVFYIYINFLYNQSIRFKTTFLMISISLTSHKKQKQKTEKNKTNAYNRAWDFYNNLLKIHFNKYNKLSDAKWNKIEHKYDPKKFFFETCNYDDWSETEKSFDTTRKRDNEESCDKTKIDEKSTDLPPIWPLAGGEEEVKEGKGLKISTPNKLITKLSILLAQTKAGNI